MFKLEKIFHFEAGHSLVHHDGKCREPHGHSYILTVYLKANDLVANGPKTNMVMDFTDITSVVKPMIEDYFDHHWINDTLETDSPTVEYMTRWIYHYLKPKLPHLYAVSLNETATSRVTYSEE